VPILPSPLIVFCMVVSVLIIEETPVEIVLRDAGTVDKAPTLVVSVVSAVFAAARPVVRAERLLVIPANVVCIDANAAASLLVTVVVAAAVVTVTVTVVVVLPPPPLDAE